MGSQTTGKSHIEIYFLVSWMVVDTMENNLMNLILEGRRIHYPGNLIFDEVSKNFLCVCPVHNVLN